MASDAVPLSCRHDGAQSGQLALLRSSGEIAQYLVCDLCGRRLRRLCTKSYAPRPRGIARASITRDAAAA
jgi:hypothetical protein